MPLDHAPCTPRHGVRYACQDIPHNDGVTINPLTAWQQWCSALSNGDELEMCRGNWQFADPLVLTAPTIPTYMRLRGAGSGRSVITGSSQSGAVLRVPRAGGSHFGGFSVTNVGTCEQGVVWGGEQFSACHVEDVHSLGSFRDTAFMVTGPNANDGTFRDCRMHNWDLSYVYQSAPTHQSALGLTNTRNHEFTGCEIHSFVSNSQAILGRGSVSRITFNGRVWSVSPKPLVPPEQPPGISWWGLAQARFMGPTRGILMLNDVLECEAVQVPGQPVGVTLSHAPTFGLLFDQGVSGLEIRGAEIHASYAILGGGGVFDQVNLSAEYAVPSSSVWALYQDAAAAPSQKTLRNSDIYCGGLRVQPAGSIDRDTRLRSAGPISLYAGATDARAVT